MFRVLPIQPYVPIASTSRSTQALEDILLDEDFSAEGPSVKTPIGQGRITGPGESIADSGKWMRYEFVISFFWEKLLKLEFRGHGTYALNDKVVASVAGTLERVNKLISVKPLRTKSV